MNVAYYIAKRYFISKSSNNAINFISVIALVGTILGTMALFIVLSGFAGLKSYSLQFSDFIDPDLKAEVSLGKSYILTEETEQKLQAIEEVEAYSKIIEEYVIASFEGKPHPAILKGVDEQFNTVNAIDSLIPYGNWVTQGTSQIVVGYGISHSLSVGVLDYGKYVSLMVPKPGKGQITSINKALNKVLASNVGVFDINDSLNDKLIYAPIDLATDLLHYKPNEVSGIEFKLSPDADEDAVKEALLKVLGNTFTVKNKIQLNDALYKMLNTENLAVYLIFTLVLIIALFNVIGSIIMMILDKKQNLNTLFNLGATIRTIRRIFFFQGVLMSFVGGCIGLGLGFILIVLQQYFNFIMLTPNLPYPVEIKGLNAALVFSTIIGLGCIASKIASSRISKKLLKNV